MVALRELFCLHKKFLVYNLVMRNLKVKYRRSALGFLWTLLIPISQAAIYYFVFQRIMKIQIESYVPFILSGVMFWVFFSNTLNEAMESLLNNSNLISKIPIPPQIFPWVASLSHGINLALAIPVIIAVTLLSGLAVTPAFALIPVLLIEIMVIAYSIGLILALVMVFFRDLRYVLALVLQVWMYATPVIFHERMIPESMRWILWANPIGQIFPALHEIVLTGQSPTPSLLAGTAVWMLASVIAARLTLSLAIKKGVCEWL
jgi:ABC-2 type transport system permease protein